MFTRQSIRSALQAWKRADALGQHPLARVSIVEARRVAAGYGDTPTARGAALRDVLRAAIESLRPDGGQPDFADDRWRPFIILTQQYIEGHSPGFVAERLSIAPRTYHHAQANALDTLADLLREQEHSAAVIGQNGSGSTADLGVQGLGNVNGTGLVPGAADQDVGAGEHTPSTRLVLATPHQGRIGTQRGRRILLRSIGLLSALAILLAAFAALGLRQHTAQPRAVVDTISLDPSRTGFIAANPATHRVYVDAQDVPGIAVIDAATNAVLTKIPTAGYHRGIAVNPATNRVYVAQQFAGSVRVIDGTDNRVLGDISVPGLIHTVGDLAINPVTNRLYVIRANNNDVAVFDAATNDFLGAVAFGPPSAPGCPVVACDSGSIAVNPSTNLIYVTNSASARVTVIDGATNQVITRVPVGESPNTIAVNPVTDDIYIANTHDRTISVIDGASHRVIATVPVEVWPTGVAVNPNTNRVYVANIGSKIVSVIDGAANSVIASVPVGVPASAIALIPATGRVYVTGGDAHNVKVIEDVAPPFVTWIPLPVTGGPPAPRGDTANRPLGYDAAGNRLVFFGGMQEDGTLLNDTWVLANADGTTGAPQWIELATTNTPPPRRSHAGAYDAANNRLITYGGCLGGCTPMDNKVYVLTHANGLGGTPTWQELNPMGSPPPQRDGHTAVYDPTSNRLIVFGGDNCCGQRYDDTWVLTHANGLGGTPAWVQLITRGGPPPGRVGHSAVYDVAHNRMIVFGGAASGGNLSDAWVLAEANGLEGTPTWSHLAPAGTPPAARTGHSAVYDPGTGQMLVLGGSGAADVYGDIWLLTYANGLAGTPAWRQVIPSGTLPVARTSSTAVYHAASNRVVIFGGGTLTGPINDAWVLVNAIPPGG